MSVPLLIVAGEVSGDLHAAAMLRALRRRRPDIAAWGIGGNALRSAGMDLVRHVREMETIGLTDALRRLPHFFRVYAELVRRLDAHPPAAAVLVDFPGFNLRLARALRARGIPVIYYICPQIWAWRHSRIRTIARNVRRLLVIFPFETDLFQGRSLRVEFVGHPLADAIAEEMKEPAPPLPWAGEPRLAVLPGSRRQEIARILPPLLGAAARVEKERPGASFLLAVSDEEAAGWVRGGLATAGERPRKIEIVAGRTRQVLREARAAWVASGTATLEAAMLGCPMIVVYRTSPLTYGAARAVVRVRHIGLVNLVAGRPVCPELLQGAARPAMLARAIAPLLDDTPERRAMSEGLADVAAALGGAGAAERAAAAVAEELRSAAGPLGARA
jgi:lipid-A-disaccharide synthase